MVKQEASTSDIAGWQPMGSIDEAREGTKVRIIADEGVLKTRMNRTAAGADAAVNYVSGHAGKEGTICMVDTGNVAVKFGGGGSCAFPWDALMVKNKEDSLDFPKQDLIASEDSELSLSAEEEAQIAAAITESLAIQQLEPAHTDSAHDSQLHTTISRIGDVCADHGILSPVVGVGKATLLPLMEAASATGIQDIESHAYMATELASRVVGSGANEHGLTVDEAGALTLYTMESELYATLNGLLSNRDRSRLKPYFSYMRLLLEARAKLPVFKGVVWRGVKKDLRSKFRAGDEIFWWAFSSTTKQVNLCCHGPGGPPPACSGVEVLEVLKIVGV